MSFLASALARATKAAGVPSVSSDGRYLTAPFLSWLGFGAHTLSGPRVTEQTALGITTVYACVRVLAESVASLPLILYRRLPDGGKDRAADHDLYPLLHDAVNPDMTSFVWRETVMSHLATWGNSFSEITKDRAGRLQLWPLQPSRVDVRFEDGKRSYYYLTDGRWERLADGSVFHVPGLSFNGLVGLSPIQLHREQIGWSQATREFGQAFYRNGARPATVLSHPKNLSTGAIGRLAAQMDELRGTRNAGKTVVLEEGLTVTEVGVAPDDAQYVEVMKFQREEIAAMFRMQPHMVGILDRATFSNIEQQSTDFVVYTLRPWLVRIEQEIKNQFLFDQPDIYAEFLVDGLLRGDAVSRAQSLEIQRRNGVVTRQEWRAIENRNPLPFPDDVWEPAGANYIARPLDGSPATQEPEVTSPADEDRPPNVIELFTAATKSANDAAMRVAEESIGAQERISERFASTIGRLATSITERPITVEAPTYIHEGAVQIASPITVQPPSVTVEPAEPRSVRKSVVRDDAGRITELIEEPV